MVFDIVNYSMKPMRIAVLYWAFVVAWLFLVAVYGYL